MRLATAGRLQFVTVSLDQCRGDSKRDTYFEAHTHLDHWRGQAEASLPGAY